MLLLSDCQPCAFENLVGSALEFPTGILIDPKVSSESGDGVGSCPMVGLVVVVLGVGVGVATMGILLLCGRM